jgi:hypothetical protein
MPNTPRTPLERRVDRLTAAVAVLGAGLALSVAWHFVPRPQVDASRFVLRDAQGRWRGGLELDPEGNPTVRLNDERERARLFGIVTPDGRARFRLADSTGASRVVFEAEADGRPQAWLIDSRGHTAINARVEGDDRPVATLRWGSAARVFTLADSSAAPEAESPRGESRGH